MVRERERQNVSLRRGTWMAERIMAPFIEEWKPGITGGGG